ncbi:MAG: autotransporter domain-containing protein [Reyranella sp.]|nr:autotransporter domain-containing protein [Reyranella sp.]
MTPIKFGAVSRFVLFLLTILTVFSLGAPRPALADCVLNGVTVTCSGSSPGGFTAGPGVTGLAVNVVQGAAVGTGIALNDGNTVNNLGTVSVGDAAAAVTAANNNTIVNNSLLFAGAGGTGIQLDNGGSISNIGGITVGDGGIGILVGDNVRISNSGTIRFSECGSIGIFASGSGSSVTNSGSLFGTGCGTTGIAVGINGSITNNSLVQLGDDGFGLVGDTGSNIVNTGRIVVGNDGIGIQSRGNVTNSGTIIVGDGSGLAAGVLALGDNLSVTNSGTIMGGTGVAGVAVAGDNGFLNNSGTITVGDFGVGLTALGNGNSFTNSGTINVGADGSGILAAGNNSIVNNSGTINVGACGTGIDTSGGSGSRISNSGRVIGGGCGATGVAMGSGDTLTNSGYIQSSELGFAIFSTGPNNTVSNSGTLDGPVNLVSTGNNTLTNSGLITVSAPLTAGGGVAHSIDGFFTQTASGTLGLRVGPSATATNYDTLSVTGSVPGTGVANLGGTLRAQVQPGLYGSSTTYLGALSFVGSTGRFATVESGLTFLTASAVYNPTSVDLVLSRIPFNQFPGGGSNSRAIGNVLEQNYSTSLTGTQANFYSQLLQSSAPNTLSQLTGEVATAAQNASFSVFGQFFSTILDQTSTARSTTGTAQAPGGGQQAGGQQTASLRSTTPGGGTRMAMISAEPCPADVCDARTPAAAPRVSAWMQGFGGAGSVDRSASVGSSRVDMTAGGGATGVDVRLDPKTLIGFTMGTTTAGYSLTDLQSYGTAQSIVLGLYGGYTTGPAYLDGVLGYGFGSFTTNRSVSTGSISEQINAAFNGSQYGGSVEGGWRFTFGENMIAPYGGLTVQALQQSGYTETSRNVSTGGPGMLGLTVQPQTTTSVRSTLGMQFVTAIHANDDNAIRPWLKLGWAHEFNTNRSATATLSTVLPGAPFTVTGAQPLADALIVRAGFDLDLGNMIRLYGQFDGDFSGNARSYAGTGGVRLIW